MLLLLLVLSAAQGLAATAARNWDGPKDGPARQPGHYLVTYIAQDLRNGGIGGNYRAFASAARLLGWQIQVLDAQGDNLLLRKAFASAIASRSNGIILGGFEAASLSAELAQAQRAHIVLVGWHAAARPGVVPGLFYNISTDPQEVARSAANHVIQQSRGSAGVVIFNDARFDIANSKTRYMQEQIQRCSGCKLLAIENIPINSANQRMEGIVRQLNQRYGRQWTHTLAINDVYFDEMNYPLLHAGRADIRNISAGDGSSKAITRIRAGLSQQVATVAEPLGVQGWQLADEMNRAFANAKPSGYVSKPILLTRQLLQQLGNQEIDAGLPYQQAYRAIWFAR
ncbi:ribose ABC transporter, periplasmic ribose-binding protein [Aquitalea magnusonii]|uniref:Ribose ABC transporter, periplasmic ribose-binding protein n=1 Tax=Aquitalea magnusonii TaxID=332411 RepID=A0A3G9G9Q4_9NEIS|nr:ribose ABC transporter, periplasmic ribose-binding protein [Aquitalea magnusonii]